MAGELSNAISSARALQQGLDQHTYYVEMLKQSFQAFKDSWVFVT